MMESITALLELIRDEWAEFGNSEAQRVAAMLAEVLKQEPSQEPWSDPKKLRRPPPPFPLKLPRREGDNVSEIIKLIRAGDSLISWKTPKQLEVQGMSLEQLLGGADRFKSAMLVGTPDLGAQYHSDTLYVGLTWLAPGLRYPPHAHDANELYQVLSGEASWGPTASHMAVKTPGEFIHHPPCLPHSIHVPLTEPLLTIYAWTGQLNGRFWFGDTLCGEKFSKELKNVEDPRQFYNEMAENYEEVVRGWGYNMPEMVAEKIAELVQSPKDTRVLDLGCGDGMVGRALRDRGFVTIHGMDLSPGMLAKAEARGIYSSLKEVDLLATLPLEDNAFPALTCVGTSTYLKPSVLKEWLRVTTVGAIIAFTHKTLVLDTWEKEQKELENQGLWKLVYRSPPLYYLPSGPLNPSEERVFVFCYEKL